MGFLDVSLRNMWLNCVKASPGRHHLFQRENTKLASVCQLITKNYEKLSIRAKAYSEHAAAGLKRSNDDKNNYPNHHSGRDLVHPAIEFRWSFIFIGLKIPPPTGH